jgi:hypothetical protein
MLVMAKTFDFKDGFVPASGLSGSNIEKLYSFFSEISSRFSLSRCNTKLYATGIFREILDKQSFVEDFFTQTGLLFNIVSHDLEAFYLEKAWIGRVADHGPLLVINIGGKTTELIFYRNGMIGRKLLSIGVGTILQEYSSINEEYSPISLDRIVDFIRGELPKIDEEFNTAIYTGGELTYMKIAGYALQKNSVFSDNKHPYLIKIDDYCHQNQRVFSNITLTELRNMMPKNPDWMNGARACSALAQAICLHYQVKEIIPSDSNMIDGVDIQEARSVVICGSFNKHLKLISELIDTLNEFGIDVLSPKNTDVVGNENGFILFKNDNIINHCTWSVEALHLKAIELCDMVIICNFEGYVGTKTALEIGYAYKCGKKIIFLEENEIVDDFDIPSEVNILKSKCL